MADPTVIVAAARTPMGSLLGELSGHSATALGAVAIAAAVGRAGVDPHSINEVLMGNCLGAGLGQAPARQAALGAGLPLSVGAVTLSKMCGSGLRALMFAHDMLQAQSAQVVVAGGMESMSNAPHLVYARKGLRYGAGRLLDHMALDGLEDAYEPGRSMGELAQACADHFKLTREQQDAFAVASTQRVLQAQAQGHLNWEMASVNLSNPAASWLMDRDEPPTHAKLDKVSRLKPAFKVDGTITAANASGIADGAAALVLMRESTALRAGLQPLARWCASAIHAHEPAWFATAPVGAIQKTLSLAGWTCDHVDLWEINEAFAAVPLLAMEALQLPHDRVNVHGGACAMGHPIGASGARVVVTLIGALRQRGLRSGVAALCIGGGEAAAMALEVM